MTTRERFVLTVIPAFVLGIITTRCVEALYFYPLIDWPATFQSIQNIAQTLAFAAAGYWTYRLFVRHRMDHIKAEITQEIIPIQLTDQHRLLRVVVQIQNSGNVELCPTAGEISIHKISPMDKKLLEGFLSEVTNIESQKPEESWPTEQTCTLDFKGDDDLTLEPNEIERYSRDFILPTTTEVVQVHSVIWLTDDPNGTIWDETTVVFLTKKEPNEDERK